MKTKNIFLTVALALSTTFAFAQGTIAGSAHDFGDGVGADGWVTVTADGVTGTKQICKFCHAPHNNQNAVNKLLWNHDVTAVASYTVYGSPTLQIPAGAQPGETSKLCLSCHDGTVALDAYGGATGSAVITTGMNTVRATANFGTDLSNDHPIGIVYDVADTGLKPLNTPVSGVGITSGITDITSLLYTGGTTVECSSCHDVHNNVAATSSKLLVRSNDSSGLCLTCHAK